MAKEHRRSFRYSEEINQIIENFEGNNLSEKFDRLIRHCHLLVPEAERTLQTFNDAILEKKKELSEVTRQVRVAEAIIRDLGQIKMRLESVATQAEELDGQMNLFEYTALKAVPSHKGA